MRTTGADELDVVETEEGQLVAWDGESWQRRELAKLLDPKVAWPADDSLDVVLARYGLADHNAGAPIPTPARLCDDVFLISTTPCHSYLIDCGADGLALIDPGITPQFDVLLGRIASLHLGSSQVCWVLNTHGHFDHSMADEPFRQRGAELFVGAGDVHAVEQGSPETVNYLAPELLAVYPRTKVAHSLAGGETLALGNKKLHVISTPGHTAGSVCFAMSVQGKSLLFTGDTVMHDCRLGWQGPFTDNVQYARSLQQLAVAAHESPVDLLLPGHGTIALDRGYLDLDKASSTVQLCAANGVDLATLPYPHDAYRWLMYGRPRCRRATVEVTTWRAQTTGAWSCVGADNINLIELKGQLTVKLTASDFHEIHRLHARYCHAVDFADLDTVMSCFSPDGSFEISGNPSATRRGERELRRSVGAQDGKGHVRHTIVGSMIDGDDTHARSVSTILITGDFGPAVGRGRSTHSEVIVTGLYHDDLVRVDGRWVYYRRRYTGDGGAGIRELLGDPLDIDLVDAGDAEEQLTALDREGIRQLLVRVGYTLDFEDYRGFAQCFTPDGSYSEVMNQEGHPEIRVTASGRDELWQFAVSESEVGYRGHVRHGATNAVISGTGARANVSSYALVTMDFGLPTQPRQGRTAAVRYTGVCRDEVVKVDGRWLLEKRTFRKDTMPEVDALVGKPLDLELFSSGSEHGVGVSPERV